MEIFDANKYEILEGKKVSEDAELFWQCGECGSGGRVLTHVSVAVTTAFDPQAINELEDR